jgi:hypothetical protein
MFKISHIKCTQHFILPLPRFAKNLAPHHQFRHSKGTSSHTSRRLHQNWIYKQDSLLIWRKSKFVHFQSEICNKYINLTEAFFHIRLSTVQHFSYHLRGFQGMTRTDLPFDSLNYGQAFIRTTFPSYEPALPFIAVIIFINNRPIHDPWSNVTHEIYRQFNLPSKIYFVSVHITSTFGFIWLIEILVFSSWNVFYYLSAISKEIIPPGYLVLGVKINVPGLVIRQS